MLGQRGGPPLLQKGWGLRGKAPDIPPGSKEREGFSGTPSLRDRIRMGTRGMSQLEGKKKKSEEKCGLESAIGELARQEKEREEGAKGYLSDREGEKRHEMSAERLLDLGDGNSTQIW